MTLFVRPEDARHDGDPERVAIVLPGRGYTPAGPLLHYARAVLVHHGWTVQEIWWPELPDPESTPRWVQEQATAALERESAERVLLVGKSMGTFAAPVAAERELPAIWLTPLLTERTVADAIARTTAPRLLVGGTDDPSWESETAKRSGADVLEIPGAHHGLEIAGDPIRSVEVLGRITEAMDRFVEAADTGR